MCAWSEGWADFYALAVNGDECFDWNNIPCSGRNLETPTQGTPGWDEEDLVEGRVAGALWDIYDVAADGHDHYSGGFNRLWDTMTTQSYDKFREFWDQWRNTPGYNTHDVVQSIYQNTINYNTSPNLNLPDVALVVDTHRENAFRLWDYASDPESAGWQLSYRLLWNSNPNCHVSIDDQDYVDIHPTAGWAGVCDVTVEADDGLGWVGDEFRVTVFVPVGVSHLPLVMRQGGSGSSTPLLPADSSLPTGYPAPSQPSSIPTPQPESPPSGYP